MIRADFITSIALMVFGAAIVFESWRMPRFAEGGRSVWTEPGIVPGMLGIGLFVMAAILCVHTMRARRAATGPDEPGEGGHLRTAGACAICVLYAGGLVTRIPFWLATFLFITAFVLVFEFIDPEQRARWKRQIGTALAVALFVSLAVSYVFQELFLVRLP